MVSWQSLLLCESYQKMVWNSFWGRARKILAGFSYNFSNTFFWDNYNASLLSELQQTEVIFPNLQTLTSTMMKSFVWIQFKMSEFSADVCWKEVLFNYDVGIVRETKTKKNSDCIDIVHVIANDNQKGYKQWKIVADWLTWWFKWRKMYFREWYRIRGEKQIPSALNESQT